MNIKTGFSKILVTGPQRSGTRITAKIIAHDNNIKYIDESEIKIRDYTILKNLLKQDERLVIQCPGICHCIEMFDYPGILIIMVIRDIEDIVKSQERISWGSKNKERELKLYGKKEGIISKIKYDHWEEQKNQISNWFEIRYDDLKNHPLFIPKKERKGFEAGQTGENL